MVLHYGVGSTATPWCQYVWRGVILIGPASDVG
jgi:hypothetical protein